MAEPAADGRLPEPRAPEDIPLPHPNAGLPDDARRAIAVDFLIRDARFHDDLARRARAGETRVVTTADGREVEQPVVPVAQYADYRETAFIARVEARALRRYHRAVSDDTTDDTDSTPTMTDTTTADEEPTATDLLVDDRAAATFSGGRTFRDRLRRTWDRDGDTLAFVMLNPSTADEAADDPTIRRCRDYAERWDDGRYGTLLVGNLFAFRATDPADLRRRLREAGRAATVGPENDANLRRMAREAHRVVAAWGARGSLAGRGPEVARMLREDVGVDLYALGTTADGHPVHPLYQPADLEPQPFAYDDSPGDEH